jgi:hypothetical protein
MDSILKRITNDYPSSYKESTSLQERIQESQRILIKHPQYIPVILECEKSVCVLKKRKYLVSENNSVSHLLMSIREQLKIDNNIGDKAFFLFCGNSILCPTSLIKEIYINYLDLRNKNCTNKEELKDKFLYINLVAENTFG